MFNRHVTATKYQRYESLGRTFIKQGHIISGASYPALAYGSECDSTTVGQPCLVSERVYTDSPKRVPIMGQVRCGVTLA